MENHLLGCVSYPSSEAFEEQDKPQEPAPPPPQPSPTKSKKGQANRGFIFNPWLDAENDGATSLPSETSKPGSSKAGTSKASGSAADRGTQDKARWIMDPKKPPPPVQRVLLRLVFKDAGSSLVGADDTEILIGVAHDCLDGQLLTQSSDRKFFRNSLDRSIGLRRLHAVGILQRDVSAGNLMMVYNELLDEYEGRVIDLGLAHDFSNGNPGESTEAHHHITVSAGPTVRGLSLNLLAIGYASFHGDRPAGSG